MLKAHLEFINYHLKEDNSNIINENLMMMTYQLYDGRPIIRNQILIEQMKKDPLTFLQRMQFEIQLRELWDDDQDLVKLGYLYDGYHVKWGSF